MEKGGWVLVIILAVILVVGSSFFIFNQIEFSKCVDRAKIELQKYDIKSEAYNFTKEDVRDTCFIISAIEKLDLSVCNKIKNKNNKLTCYGAMALELADPKICDIIRKDSSVQADDCYSRLAFTTLDSKLCKSVVNESYSSYCYFLIAIETKNFSICDQIKNRTIKEVCILETRNMTELNAKDTECSNYFYANQYETAIQCYTELLESAKFSGYYATRGQAYSLLGDCNKANEDYDEALKLNPENEIAKAAKSYCLLKTQDVPVLGKTEPVFDFDTNESIIPAGLTITEVSNGILKLRTDIPDSWFYSPGVYLDTSKYTMAEIRAKLPADTNPIKIYWIEDDSYLWEESKSMEFVDVLPDDQWYTSTIRMADNPGWNGTVARFRIDPGDYALRNVEIDYIKFFQE